MIKSKNSISPFKYRFCFQSRIAKKYLSPFTDEVITTLAKEEKNVCWLFVHLLLQVVNTGQGTVGAFPGNG